MGIAQENEKEIEPGTDAQWGLWPPNMQRLWPSIESFQLDRKMYAMYIACRSEADWLMPYNAAVGSATAPKMYEKIESDGGILLGKPLKSRDEGKIWETRMKQDFESKWVNFFSNNESKFDGSVEDRRGFYMDLIGNRRSGSEDLQTANDSGRMNRANDQLVY